MAVNQRIGVYLIENKLNGKVYVGASSHLDRRWKEHHYLLRKNKHWNNHMQAAFNQNPDTFEFHVIKEFNTSEEAFIFEQNYLEEHDLYSKGYNQNKAGFTSKVGSISRSLKGRKLSEEHKQNLRGPRPHYTGRKHHNVKGPIYYYDLELNPIGIWLDGVDSLGKALNIGASSISNNIWQNSVRAGKYIFSYTPLTHAN